MNDEDKVKEFLATQKHMIIAVVLDDGTPWAVPVSIKRHEGREFEWDSHLSTEHSKAILQHAAIAVTIFQKKEDSQIGFYAKGKAELLEEFKPGFGRYRFTTEKAWINDETFKKREVNL
jgi:hypothetical protein